MKNYNLISLSDADKVIPASVSQYSRWGTNHAHLCMAIKLVRDAFHVYILNLSHLLNLEPFEKFDLSGWVVVSDFSLKLEIQAEQLSKNYLRQF